MRRSTGVLVGIVVLALVALNSIAFTVNEWEQVVVTHFGEPVRVVKEPGLYFKLPNPIEKLSVFSDRLLDYDSKPEDIYTSDQKILRLDNYARWRIVDAKVFLERLRSTNEGMDRLDDIIFSEMRQELGQHTLSEVVAEKREELLRTVTERCNLAAQPYGIQVVDVRIKRADLPQENEQSVFDRMRTEREREAKGYRSRGEESAIRIRAESDFMVAKIMAEAYEISEQFRGEGDAEALAIYAKAYSGAEDFYKFNRTLEAYDRSLDDKTVLVQPAESEFFKLLKGQP